MQKLLVERGFDPRSSGLYAEHVSTALQSSIQQTYWKPILLNVRLHPECLLYALIWLDLTLCLNRWTIGR
jgi:hypothetical protein